jgi:hypothetical protein
MAHRTLKNAYSSLAERLNRFPQGAPPTELLFRILRVLFSEDEAARVALLPIKPFTAQTAAGIWKVRPADARRVLDGLAGRALLVDWDRDGETFYVLPPPMAGFFEFSMMRVRDDVDQKVLSELFYQYLNVEEDFVRDLFTRGETQLGRTFVHEPALSTDNALHVLDYERATTVVRSATHMGVGTCYCRHKMEHMGRACEAPRRTCAARRCRRGARPPGRGVGAKARAVRGERAGARGVHLQLLRMLLRGDDRRATLRHSQPGAHDELPSRDRRGGLQRLHEVR